MYNNRKWREMAQEILRPENIPAQTLSYIADWTSLNQPPISSGQIVGAQRYAWAIDVVEAQLVVNSSAAETTVYSYTLGGGTLGTQGAVQLLLLGDYLNSSGSGSTFTVSVKYGGTTMYSDATASLASQANRTPLLMDIVLSGAAATNAQFMHGLITRGDRNTAATTGLGAHDAAGASHPISGSAAVDSTLNKDLVVTVQHSVNNANTSYRRNYALLTKIGH